MAIWWGMGILCGFCLITVVSASVLSGRISREEERNLCRSRDGAGDDPGLAAAER